jgi:hypothetical protein
MDNQYTQSEVAYETSPKEKNTRRGMPSGDAQFGKNKMPQDQPAAKSHSKKVTERHVMSMSPRHGRHKENR